MEEQDEGGQPMVWLLLKALYGLKQSGNRWMMLLIKVLKKLGMKQSMADTHVTVVQDGPHDGDLLYTLVPVRVKYFCKSHKAIIDPVDVRGDAGGAALLV